MAEENKAKKIVDWFGGLSGKAAKDIQGRKSRIQQAEDEAIGISGDTEAADGKKRPGQSKKWTE